MLAAPDVTTGLEPAAAEAPKIFQLPAVGDSATESLPVMVSPKPVPDAVTKPLESTLNRALSKWATPFLVLSVVALEAERWISIVMVFAASESVRITLAPTTPDATCAPVMLTSPATVGKIGSVPGGVKASGWIESIAPDPPARSRVMLGVEYPTVMVPRGEVMDPFLMCGEAVEPMKSCPSVVSFPPRAVPSKEQLSAFMIASSPVIVLKPAIIPPP